MITSSLLGSTITLRWSLSWSKMLLLLKKIDFAA